MKYLCPVCEKAYRPTTTKNIFPAHGKRWTADGWVRCAGSSMKITDETTREGE